MQATKALLHLREGKRCMMSECMMPPQDSSREMIAWAVAAAAIGVAAVFAGFLLALVLIVQPWNPARRDHAALLARQPYFLFWIVTAVLRLAARFQRLKPAPLQVAEVAVTYIHSHVLFVLVNLRLAEALRDGPKTAQQLADWAAAAQTGASINPEWLARTLKLAVELGLVKRRRARGSPSAAQVAPYTPSATLTNTTAPARHDHAYDPDFAEPGSASKDVAAAAAAPAGERNQQQPFSTGYSSNDMYSANAVTAVLCRDHPNCMADFVKMMEDHAAPFLHLSEGMRKSVTPFTLWSGGRSFWQHLEASPRHAATFDGAMRACNHTGAKMAVEQYPWNKYDVVVDIGGGNGQFLAALLSKHPQLQGVLVDQQGQVDRGQKWWAQEFTALLPRVEFVVGDMFQPSTLPRPRPGLKTCYVLKQILHDWSDADSLKILTALRAVISQEDVAAGRACLVVLETGAMETVTPALLQHRLEADMVMLMSFGDGKERDERQTRVLLEAAGFTPGRLLPTTGLMTLQEATPRAQQQTAA